MANVPSTEPHSSARPASPEASPHAKLFHLRKLLTEMESVVIGYSGGVDSTFLLRIAGEVLGSHAVAVIGKSETYPEREYEDALRVAASMGATVEVVRTEETDNIKFRENPSNRCYFCKTELFSKLHDIAAARGIAWIADGTITDDLGDFRPGMQAKAEQQVRSPLLEAGLSKAEIRLLSKEIGLETWDKGSFACLSSRFPYGMGISRENLSRVDRAETIFRDHHFRHFRVRFQDEQSARIEVGQEELHRLEEPELREAIMRHLSDLGFASITIDPRGYRTGSMNEKLPAGVPASAVLRRE